MMKPFSLLILALLLVFVLEFIYLSSNWNPRYTYYLLAGFAMLAGYFIFVTLVPEPKS